MKPSDIDNEANRLNRESDEIEAQISSADLYDSQILAARRALIEPREKAADKLRQAAEAMRSIPPLGLSSGQGKTG